MPQHPREQQEQGGETASGKRRLSARDWADAALAAIGERGLAGVAVEPLAARLGTTKGSFYWHFANRGALVKAALARWEELSTEAVIAETEQEPDPQLRLRRLLGYAVGSAPGDPLELSLLTAVDQPQVAAALRRVTERRIGYVAEVFAELGFAPAQARLRATAAYTTYLGHIQLNRAVPGLLPSGADRDPYLNAVLDTLLRRD
ncbi:TetR/AcrR family transcriptional regulator [Streptomyces sp. B8F3]|uniref:TetR/AcrR family transcriptional regulator n=1 Tax=unclassified Streptomyces TaxID=2593676 RepID=UPI00325F4999